jgi:imidazolonepropionase-like amidohydrolase
MSAKFAALLLLTTLARAESGKLAVFFLQLPVGQETWDLNNGVLKANFEYTERGSRVALDATLKLKTDLTPEQFEAHGRSYRPFTVDVSLTPQAQPGPFFTIASYNPLSVQMMMLRYWLRHHRPRTITGLPGNVPIEIERTGFDTVHGERLTRYSITNVVWGRESVWLDKLGRIAAASTYAGGLPLEAVRDDLKDALPQFVRSAVADRIREFESYPRSIRPSTVEYAITGATLINGTGAAPRQANIVIQNGLIKSIGSALPPGIQTIDGRGKTVLPGLWEMHAHFAQVEYGPAYLAAGVTTARDCGEEFEFITAARNAIDAGALGPKLILAGLVDRSGTGTFGVNWADTPEQGRAMVAKYKVAGFAQMKIYNRIQPDVLKVITAEAHRLGLSVTGHVPEGMTMFDGIEDGMDQINHIGPVVQAVRSAGLEKTIQFLKQHHTVVDPTLAWNELLGHAKGIDISSFEPGFAKAPYTLRAMIGSAFGEGRSNRSQLDLVRALYQAGVPIVAGTDKAVPAHSLHRELELYVQAGLTPMQVIQLATLGSARVMGMDRESGSIEPGKRADVILVDGNPLEDFSSLRKISSVITHGVPYNPADLWKIAGFQP